MDRVERGLFRVATPTEAIAQRPKPITAVPYAHRTRLRFTKPIDAFEMAYQDGVESSALTQRNRSLRGESHRAD